MAKTRCDDGNGGGGDGMGILIELLRRCAVWLRFFRPAPSWMGIISLPAVVWSNCLRWEFCMKLYVRIFFGYAVNGDSRLQPTNRLHKRRNWNLKVC